MSKASEAVKNWRNRTKERIVNAMGSKCVECEYTGCYAVFDLHHIDPTQKKFSMGGMRANPVAWTKIVEELRKCVLLCANCHREVENGYRTLKNPVSTFDESYAVYEIERPINFRGWTESEGLCAYCSESFKKYRKTQKYCSDVCQKSANRVVREQLNRTKQRPKKQIR